MAKRTRSKHKNGLSIALKQHIKLVLLSNFLVIILLMLYILTLQASLNLYKDTSLRTENLISVGISLDTLASDLKKEGFNMPIEREQLCSYTGEKFGPGNLYCTQKLNAIDLLDESQQQQAAAVFNRVWNDEGTKLSIKNQRQNSNLINLANKLIGSHTVTTQSKTECRLDYNFAILDDEMPDSRGKSAIRIHCIEMMEHSIYPIKEDVY